MDCKCWTGRILRRPRGRTVRVRYAGLKFGCRRISGRRGWGCCPCPMTRLPVVGVNQARRICGPSVPISLRSSSPCIVAYRPTHLFFPSLIPSVSLSRLHCCLSFSPMQIKTRGKVLTLWGCKVFLLSTWQAAESCFGLEAVKRSGQSFGKIEYLLEWAVRSVKALVAQDVLDNLSLYLRALFSQHDTFSIINQSGSFYFLKMCSGV
jgi:hypothetical protein